MRRRCLRVILVVNLQGRGSRASAFDARNRRWIAREIAFCIDQGRAGFVRFVQNRISANKTKPAFNVLSIFAQGASPILRPCREWRSTDQRPAVASSFAANAGFAAGPSGGPLLGAAASDDPAMAARC